MVFIQYAPYAARTWYRVQEHTVSVGACDGYIQNVAEMLLAWVQVPSIRLVWGMVLSPNNLFQLRLRNICNIHYSLCIQVAPRYAQI